MDKLIIDISRFQDEAEVRALLNIKYVDGIIIRAASGFTQDTKYRNFVKMCRELQIPYGAYFWLSSPYYETGKRQVDNMLEIVTEVAGETGYWPKMPMCIDIEDSRNAYPAGTKDGIYAIMHYFKDRITANGVNGKYLVYMNKTDWKTTYPEAFNIIPKNHRWIAHYNGENADFTKCNYSNQSAVHQYTSSGFDDFALRIDISHADSGIFY